ncbi:MAG: RHS repeat-associated core domain-containing protein, partial [Candidatus Zixiibacteriota bacterium]
VYNIVVDDEKPGQPGTPVDRSETESSGGGSGDVVLEGQPGSGSTIVYKFLYYHLDHLGTPMAVTDGAKDIVWSSDYYPFGSLYDEQVVQSNELRFPGQYHDRESDLYYNWHRYYEPKLGRYVSADRLGHMYFGLTPYTYVANSPLMYLDIEGDSIRIPEGSPGYEFTSNWLQMVRAGECGEEFARYVSVVDAAPYDVYLSGGELGGDRYGQYQPMFDEQFNQTDSYATVDIYEIFRRARMKGAKDEISRVGGTIMHEIWHAYWMVTHPEVHALNYRKAREKTGIGEGLARLMKSMWMKECGKRYEERMCE